MQRRCIESPPIFLGQQTTRQDVCTAVSTEDIAIYSRIAKTQDAQSCNGRNSNMESSLACLYHTNCATPVTRPVKEKLQHAGFRQS